MTEPETPALYDLHAHTRISRCSDEDWTVDLALKQAQAVGLAGLALTDHLMPYTDFQELADNNRRFIELAREAGFPAWSGVEAEVLNDQGDLLLKDGQEEAFDFVMAAWGHVHLKHVELPTGRQLSDLFDFLHAVGLALCRDPRVAVIAHPWQTPSRWSEKLGFPRYEPEDVPQEMLSELAETAAETGTTLELNMAYVGKADRQEASELFRKQQRLLRAARAAGSLLSIGGDSHRGADMWRVPRIAPLLTAFDLAPEDLWTPPLPA